MKKLLPLLALLMALVCVFPAAASSFDFSLLADPDEVPTESLIADDGEADEDALIAKNVEFLIGFLDSRNYKYEQTRDNVIVLDFGIDGAYPDAELWLTVYPDGIQCEVTCNVIVDDSVMAELCRYAMYVNSTQRLTLFYLDDDNELWSVNFCALLNEDDFADYYVSALTRWEEFSQDFYDIIEGGKTAEELMD